MTWVCDRFPGSKTPLSAAAANDDDDDDDFELFGSDDEAVDEAAEKLKQERLAAYEAKKSTSEWCVEMCVVINECPRDV